jgi:hypothetical protein
MKIDVMKKDLWWVRHALEMSIVDMEHCPNPPAWGKTIPVAKKHYRALTRAIKKAYGHDMMARPEYMECR